ncbi:MAG: hypothetical protein ACFE0J_19645, partial [Elainellaceae cyanobacterium]
RKSPQLFITRQPQENSVDVPTRRLRSLDLVQKERSRFYPTRCKGEAFGQYLRGQSENHLPNASPLRDDASSRLRARSFRGGRRGSLPI